MKSTRRSRNALAVGQTKSRSSLPGSSSRHQHGSSLHAVHSVASTSQVRLQLFREAFHLIDQDRDGVITKDDLKSLHESLGLPVDENQLDEMLSEIPGELNHTKFTCMMASRAGDMDDTQVLLNAFSILDKDGVGRISIRDFCKKLRSVGYERMTAEEVNSMLKVAPIDANGLLDYRAFVATIRGKQ